MLEETKIRKKKGIHFCKSYIFFFRSNCTAYTSCFLILYTDRIVNVFIDSFVGTKTVLDSYDIPITSLFLWLNFLFCADKL